MAATTARKRKFDKGDVPETGFFFRASDHTYHLDGKNMPGCTTVLGVLNKPALVPWAARMAVEHIQSKAVFYENYADGERVGERYLVHDVDIEAAKSAHAKKRDAAADKGTDTHALVEEYVKHSIERNGGIPSPSYVGTEPIAAFVAWAQRSKVRFLATEAQFYSRRLWVAGTCDLIFEKDGKRFVGDIKTYKKIWDRVPFFQMGGYAIMAEEMGEKPFDGYCIINLPKEREFNEAEDVQYSFDPEDDKRAFEACVTIYKALKRNY